MSHSQQIVQKLWIYDLRTNLHLTLKEGPLKRGDLEDFVACWFGCSGAVSASGAGGSAVTDRRYSGRDWH